MAVEVERADDRATHAARSGSQYGTRLAGV